MKMRIFDRILLTLYTLFGIFLSVILFGIALNIIDYQVLLSKLSSGIHGWDAFILGIIAVILFLVSIRLLIAGSVSYTHLYIRFNHFSYVIESFITNVRQAVKVRNCYFSKCS